MLSLLVRLEELEVELEPGCSVRFNDEPRAGLEDEERLGIDEVLELEMRMGFAGCGFITELIMPAMLAALSMGLELDKAEVEVEEELDEVEVKVEEDSDEVSTR